METASLPDPSILARKVHFTLHNRCSLVCNTTCVHCPLLVWNVNVDTEVQSLGQKFSNCESGSMEHVLSSH